MKPKSNSLKDEIVLLNDYIYENNEDIKKILKEKINPTKEEEDSWGKSLPVLKNLLKKLPVKTELVLEASFA